MELGEGEREDLLEALGSRGTAILQLEAEARGRWRPGARGQGLSGTSCTSTSHTSFTVKASLPPPPAHYARGKALAIFPDMARGNLLQIKAAGEGYSKFTLRGRILWESPRKKKKKCELNL